MTRVRYDERELRMEIIGHAGFAEHGGDIVCAAASILMQTLETALQDCADELLPTVRKRPGEAMIYCDPEPEQERKCRDIMRTIFAGYELLANSYPDNISAEALHSDWRGK